MLMKSRKRNRKVPVEILAVRRANREVERMLLGEGFHTRTRIKKSKKVYSRKRKHNNGDEL